MIISASRRTDIPAFYTEWFINRIKAGFLLTKNPFNAHQVKRVSLLPNDVDVIVFWTRNPSKLLRYLPLLDSMGYRYYFQYTITGYRKKLETATVHPLKAIDTFQKLSNQIGKEKVVWRYDPIIMSNLTPLNEHIRLFEKIASSLSGYTDNVVISFVDLYKKTEVNLNKIEGLEYYDILSNQQELRALSEALSEIADHYNMRIATCAEKSEIAQFSINKGKCIDEVLLNKLFDIKVASTKDAGQRLECGCIKSIDIGSYNTCLHGCTYCYATYQKKTAQNNYKKHDPDSPFLIGTAEGWEHLTEEPISLQNNLFDL